MYFLRTHENNSLNRYTYTKLITATDLIFPINPIFADVILLNNVLIITFAENNVLLSELF